MSIISMTSEYHNIYISDVDVLFNVNEIQTQTIKQY